MPTRLAYGLYHLLLTSLDWLYPPTCGGCEQLGERWCQSCQQSVERLLVSICPLCGQNNAGDQVCPRCLSNPPHYLTLRSWAVFQGKIRNALHRLKYRRDVSLGEALSRPLFDYFMQLNWPIDLIVPVPLGVERMATRGYNQSELLARPLALAAGINCRNNALWRTRETHSQVGLSAIERHENVSGAFRAKSEYVTGRNILVIDDVTTTGATLDSCAVALLEAGARSVYGITMARASFLGSPNNSSA
jgi:competence protein ComFC